MAIQNQPIRRLCRTLVSAAFCYIGSVGVAYSCPDGQYKDGWFGMCLPKIGGDVGRFLERLENEVRGQVVGALLEQWIRGSKESAVSTSNPVPDDIREALTGYIPEAVLNHARYKIDDQGIINSAKITMEINGDVVAVTLDNLIVFRDRTHASDVALWAHELTHVRQFMEWGIRDFSIRYARNWKQVEEEGYRVQDNYSGWVRSGRPPLFGSSSNALTLGGAVSSFDGSLDMANIDQSGHFIVDVADVTGDGRADLVSVHTNGSAYVWPGQRNGSFGAVVSSFDGSLDMANIDQSGHFIVDVADVNGDGRADLVSANTNGFAYVWPAQRNGQFGGAAASFNGTLDIANFDQTGHFVLAIADVTGDAKSDLVSAHINGNAYVWPSQN